jgi:AAA+ ATPase superfamily predicted ATPase
MNLFRNPFRPGAGHMPPFLAGRQEELNEFKRLLEQDVIMENLILTGLRGVGKTVLLETFRPEALQSGWSWVGADLSESASVSEKSLATRLLADLAVVTSSFIVGERELKKIGFQSGVEKENIKLGFDVLSSLFNNTPGLVSDKLKGTLLFVWEMVKESKMRGIVFAYDEAQTLADFAEKEEYPLSMLLDVFQSLQRQNVPFMLALTGLPTLFPKLVEARTYSERMFRVVFLDRLDKKDSREAIIKPIQNAECPVIFNDESVDIIANISSGYPYFIQFICREVYDVYIVQKARGEEASVPVKAIIQKLDSDFFAGRWAKATDRQRDLLHVIASLDNCDSEFTIQEVTDASKKAEGIKGFSNSHVNQMLSSLCQAGLVYKNRHGRYSFAVPLLGQFIRRQQRD